MILKAYYRRGPVDGYVEDIEDMPSPPGELAFDRCSYFRQERLWALGVDEEEGCLVITDRPIPCPQYKNPDTFGDGQWVYRLTKSIHVHKSNVVRCVYTWIPNLEEAEL